MDCSAIIKLTIYTKDGTVYKGGFDSSNTGFFIEGTTPFDFSEDQFESICSGNDLVIEIFNWFCETFEDSDIPHKNDLSDGDIEQIKTLSKGTIEQIEIDSSLNYEDFFVACNLMYNYTTKEYFNQEDGDFPEEWEEIDFEE